MKTQAGKRVFAALTVGVMFLLLLLIAVGVLQERSHEKRVYQIILIPKTVDPTNDFWTGLIEGAKLGAEEFGCEIKVVGGNAENDYEGQNEIIETCIEKDPDALLIAPCSYSESTEAIEKAVAAGIKVILIDSVIDKEIANGVVATNNFKAGRELGEYTSTLLTEDSRIGIISHVQGSSTAAEREAGVRDGLGEFQDQIVDVVYCNSSYEMASELTRKMLKAHPEIDTLIGTNEYAAVGAARVAKAQQLGEQIQVVGVDNSVEEIQFLESGIIQGIVIQKPFNIGYLGVQQAVKAVEGYPMEYNLDSGCKLITKENMYEEENQRLLYPFSGQQ